MRLQIDPPDDPEYEGVPLDPIEKPRLGSLEQRLMTPEETEALMESLDLSTKEGNDE